MEEIRKNHIVQMKTRDNVKIDGIVFDYLKDRVLVLIAYESLELAKKLKELDELIVIVNTHLGIKKMFSHVISPLKSNNCIIIENNASIPVEQKREHVRVLSNAVFKVRKDDERNQDAYCINISAGGMCFSVNEAKYKLGDDVVLTLSEKDFGKEIVVSGKIVKMYNNVYSVQFMNLNNYDQDKIVKYVFSLITKK